MNLQQIKQQNDNRRRLVDKFLAEKSLYEFIKQGWPYADPSVFIDGWHIEAICEHLEAINRRDINRLLINVPFKTAKSLLTSVFYPAWVWTTQPEHIFLTGSYAKELAIRDTRRSRMLLNSYWYQQNWGDKWQFTGDQNQKSNYENNKSGSRVAFSLLGGLTGGLSNTIIVDDPLNRKDADSKTIIDKTNKTFTTSVVTRLNPPIENGAIIVIMQRLNQNDLSGHLLKRDGWTHLMLPMEFEPKRKCETAFFTDPRTKEGEILWEGISREELNKQKKELGTMDVAGQFQQRPAPPEGGVLNIKYFNYYKNKVDLPTFNFIIQFIDSAEEEGEKNDYSVDGSVGVTDNDIYWLDLWRGKCEIVKLLKKVKEKADEYNPHRLVVEKKSSGTQLIQILKREILKPITPYNPQVSKYARARAAAPMLEAGKNWLPEGAHWVPAFLEELQNFPNGEHDDQVDVFTMCNNFVRDKLRTPTFTV